MPDFTALFAPDPVAKGPDFRSLFAPDEISELEANRTLTPEEQAKVVRDEPSFGAGTKRRMAEYEGLSPERASAKYRQGWADDFREGINILSDPQKRAEVGRGIIDTGYNAVRHPIQTVENISDYYYENPDAAATDAAFAFMPARYGVKVLEKASEAPKPMPRGSVRTQEELIGSGGKRMNEAKKSEVALPVEDIIPSFSGFHARLGEKGIRINKKLHPKTYSAFEDFANFVRPKGMDNAPRPATMLDLHEVRQLAANAAKDVHPGTRKPTADAMLANELIKTIDEVIAKHPEGMDFMRGKGEIARGLKSEGIVKMVEDASKTKMWDNGDHANAIRSQINKYLKANERYLTKKEIKELKRIKRVGFTELLGKQGSLSPMQLTIGRAVEFMTGLPMGSLIFAGHYARNVANKRMPQRLENMAERIRAGE